MLIINNKMSTFVNNFAIRKQLEQNVKDYVNLNIENVTQYIDDNILEVKNYVDNLVLGEIRQYSDADTVVAGTSLAEIDILAGSFNLLLEDGDFTGRKLTCRVVSTDEFALSTVNITPISAPSYYTSVDMSELDSFTVFVWTGTNWAIESSIQATINT